MEKKENQAILDTTVRAASFWISLDFSRNLRTTFSMKVVFLPSSMCSLCFPFGFPLDSLLFKKNSIRCWNRHPELYRDSSTSHEKRSQLKVSTFGHCVTVKHWEWPRMGGYHPPQKKYPEDPGDCKTYETYEKHWKAMRFQFTVAPDGGPGEQVSQVALILWIKGRWLKRMRLRETSGNPINFQLFEHLVWNFRGSSQNLRKLETEILQWPCWRGSLLETLFYCERVPFIQFLEQ